MTDFNMKIKVHRKNDKIFNKLGRVTEDTRRGIRQAYYRIGKRTIADINKDILRKPRAGRVYIINGKRHVASVPGEAPANLTGALRKSLDFNVKGYHKLLIGYDNTVHYGEFLEIGTFSEIGTAIMEPRPGLKIGIERNQENGYYEKTYNQEIKRAIERKGR
jgi:hypothetical protein